MEILDKDFVEFIECCAGRDVKFLVVGGYALAAHGHPRATKDLDIWLLIEPTNADRLIDALADFGMEALALTRSDFLEPGVIIQLGYPPVRIDLLTTATGVTFEDCWERRMLIEVGSVDAGFISYADLIANKRASGRPQDLVDVEVLEQNPPELTLE